MANGVYPIHALIGFGSTAAIDDVVGKIAPVAAALPKGSARRDAAVTLLGVGTGLVVAYATGLHKAAGSSECKWQTANAIAGGLAYVLGKRLKGGGLGAVYHVPTPEETACTKDGTKVYDCTAGPCRCRDKAEYEAEYNARVASKTKACLAKNAPGWHVYSMEVMCGGGPDPSCRLARPAEYGMPPWVYDAIVDYAIRRGIITEFNAGTYDPNRPEYGKYNDATYKLPDSPWRSGRGVHNYLSDILGAEAKRQGYGFGMAEDEWRVVCAATNGKYCPPIKPVTVMPAPPMPITPTPPIIPYNGNTGLPPPGPMPAPDPAVHRITPPAGSPCPDGYEREDCNHCCPGEPCTQKGCLSCVPVGTNAAWQAAHCSGVTPQPSPAPSARTQSALRYGVKMGWIMQKRGVWYEKRYATTCRDVAYCRKKWYKTVDPVGVVMKQAAKLRAANQDRQKSAACYASGGVWRCVPGATGSACSCQYPSYQASPLAVMMGVGS